MNYLRALTRYSHVRAVADRLTLGNHYETDLISSGLFTLIYLPSSKKRAAVVRTSPTEIVLVAASEVGKQKVELQVHLSDVIWPEYKSEYRLPAPTMFVSDHDGGNLRRFEITDDLARWAIHGIAERAGNAEASRLGLAELDGAGQAPAADVRELPEDDRGLFLEQGLEGLAADVKRATRVRERFAPAPSHQPLLLGRSRVWSPAEYTVPAGTIVKNALDLPADAVFTAVWDDSSYPGCDVADGRGVSPLLRLIDSPEANGAAITVAEPTGSSTWRPWAPRDISKRTLDGWRYVIHAGTGPTLRELGGRRSDDFIVVDKAEKHHFNNPVALPNEADGGYTGPLPGEPHRRIQRRSNVHRTIVELDIEINGEWVWLDYAVWPFDTVDDADVRKVAEELLRRNDLCWADIDGAEIKPLHKTAVEEPRPPHRRGRFLQWVRQLAKQSKQTDKTTLWRGGHSTSPHE